MFDTRTYAYEGDIPDANGWHCQMRCSELWSQYRKCRELCCVHSIPLQATVWQEMNLKLNTAHKGILQYQRWGWLIFEKNARKFHTYGITICLRGIHCGGWNALPLKMLLKGRFWYSLYLPCGSCTICWLCDESLQTLKIYHTTLCWVLAAAKPLLILCLLQSANLNSMLLIIRQVGLVDT